VKDSPTKLHELILLLQRRIRSLREKNPFVLSAQENIILMLIASQPDLQAKNLSKHFKLHPSSVSRLLSYLKKENYIITSKSSADERANVFSFTAHGKALLEKLAVHSRHTSNQLLVHLTSNERVELGKYFSSLADGFEAPADSSTSDEDPTESPRRRLTLAMGLVGKNYLDSGYDVAEYQMLWELFRSPQPRRTMELVRAVPGERTKLIRFLSSLVESGDALKSSSDSGGGGSDSLIQMSSSGRRRFGEIHKNACEIMQKAANKLTVSQQKRFRGLIARALQQGEGLDSIRPRVAICRSRLSRQRARAFIVKEAVLRGGEQNLPDSIASSRSYVALLLQGSVPIAVIEIASKKSTKVLEFLYVKERAHFEEHSNILLASFSRKRKEVKFLAIANRLQREFNSRSRVDLKNAQALT
jgi:DNA-binding MarR family transcriptional regulator